MKFIIVAKIRRIRLGHCGTPHTHIHIYSTDAPENTSFMVQHPNKSAVELGTVVTFTCTSMANPAPYEYKLFSDGTEVHNSSYASFSATVSQSGVYTYSCEAVNKVGRQRSSSEVITVYGEPSLLWVLSGLWKLMPSSVGINRRHCNFLQPDWSIILPAHISPIGHLYVIGQLAEPIKNSKWVQIAQSHLWQWSTEIVILMIDW